MTMFDLTPFADEDLDPRRTTRHSTDPWNDAPDSLIEGDLLLVDTTAYAGPSVGVQWCHFVRSSPGSASVYPYEVQIPGLGRGQYRASEVLGWARPLSLHELVREIRLIHA